jgi:hypothetical protein
MALGSVAVFGVATASASTTTPTITLTDPKAIFNNGSTTIVATASVAGTVNFTLAGTTITGCGAEATTTATPFIATCSWTPAAAGATTLSATLTPTDATDYTSATAPVINEIVAAPVQGTTTSPISLYVDTILASGSTGALAPKFGTGCEITNEFIVGQTIVFRVYGNDADLGGVALTSQNVSSATVTVGGVATPLKLAFGNHSGVAFWTAPLPTGAAAGLYNTLGVISYKVTFNTDAVPAVVKSERFTKIVITTVNGKRVAKRVAYHKNVTVTPAVPGAVGTFASGFTASSVATLNALPAS